ncbi:hypothetical protein EW026_g1398 [Hermanssonia centrifuga]|uniref:DUF6589 domain-containing protein n=1 Tax=Hermanssonia centrifuga TaxID=98765 RepID=A0A4S4KW70_9APHY|nr:hypothetical protein EW026_g1398 [Hermanssonia centrifuga]
MVFKAAEQIIGQTDSQENGTCATVFPLYDAKDEDMLFSDLLASHENAPLLSVKDINLTRDEGDILHACLVHTILRIVVGFGGAGFSRFAEELRECVPTTLEKIPLHKTETYPLPAMNIDESSTVGNAQVIDTIFDMLGYDDMNEKALGQLIDQYSKVATFEDLKAHAVQILSSYANAEVVQDLRAARRTSSLEDFNAADESQGDMVFENALLFMRDALHICEFTDTIKSGDSGRIVIMLKRLALLYRGTGQTNPYGMQSV